MNMNENKNQNQIQETQTYDRKTKVMLAWSNGKETHLHSDMMYLVEEEHLKRLDLQKRLEQELPLGTEHYCRQLSLEYERYSDELWNLGLHVESYKVLLYSATALFKINRSWINHRCTCWYHHNLRQFRRLFHRCRQRAEQDIRLMPLFNASEVKQIYERMLDEYAECNISDRIKIKDWSIWDDIYQWDGDDPLCD